MRYVDPFAGYELLRREIDRAFQVAVAGQETPNVFLPGLSARAYPLVNLAENEDAIEVEALAPGVSPETLDVTVNGDQLSISGEKPSEDIPSEAYHRCERAAGRFVRTFTLPIPVDEAKVAATYKNGVLHITLPKAEAAKPKRIEVRAG